MLTHRVPPSFAVLVRLLGLQQTLQIRGWGRVIPSPIVGLVSASKNWSQSASSEFELQTDLPFATRQSLGNRAKAYHRLVSLYGRRVAVVQEVEELE